MSKEEIPRLRPQKKLRPYANGKIIQGPSLRCSNRNSNECSKKCRNVPEKNKNESAAHLEFRSKDLSGSNTKSKNFSNDITVRRPVSSCYDQRRQSRATISCDDPECGQFLTVKTYPVQNKTSPDRKSVKSVTSDSVSTSSREKKYGFGLTAKNTEDNKILYPEGMETVSFLILATEKQQEIVRMLQSKSMEFRKKLVEENECCNLTDNVEVPRLSRSRGHVESQHTLLHQPYNSALEETSHLWINLLYFILNLRVNLIKIINKTGREFFVPNVAVERDILSRAIECVHLFSVLKMKSFIDDFERHRDIDELFDINNQAKINEDKEIMALSLMCESEFMERKAREIVAKLKKVNQKRTKMCLEA